MKRLIFTSVLALSTLWFATPAKASVPPLPTPAASFNAGSLHVDVYGTQNKPAIIFIPGLTCGPWEWAGEIRRFSNDYSIYALTLPGFDGQPAVTGDLFGKVSQDFWDLLSSRHIAKPIIVGHSLGGTLGFLLAQQHSDRLGALVAVDGMPIYPGMQMVDSAQRSAIAQRMASMMGAMKTPAQFEAAERTYSLPLMVSSPADADAIAPLAARSDAGATAQWMQQDLTLDLRPNLSMIAIPVLELTPFDPKLDPNGPAKIASAAEKQAYYASLLKGDTTAKVQVIEPSRHFIMYDQPEALHAAIASFIANREP